MSFSLDRRRFLGTALVGAAVVAFDPLRGGWVTAAAARPRARREARSRCPTWTASSAPTRPRWRPRPTTSATWCTAPRWPCCGRARSDDVVALVRYANRHGIAVSMRGQGHSTNGQSQVHAGVVIDSSTLSEVHEIGADRVTADAGVLWIDLARATLAHGLTPPVFTDYLDLSVGGTLNAGGIGGTTQRVGMQVDNVLALEVVTGRGELVSCSPTRNRALFEAVLGSLGQLASWSGRRSGWCRRPPARGVPAVLPDLDTYPGRPAAGAGRGPVHLAGGPGPAHRRRRRLEFFIERRSTTPTPSRTTPR